MATPHEQFNPKQRIEAVKQRSPLVKYLLTGGASSMQLRDYTAKAREEIITKTGLESDIYEVASNYEEGMRSHAVFHRRSERSQRITAIATFIAIGYQIGNMEDALALESELIEHYNRIEFGSINRFYAPDSATELNPVDIWMAYGVNFRMVEESLDLRGLHQIAPQEPEIRHHDGVPDWTQATKGFSSEEISLN